MFCCNTYTNFGCYPNCQAVINNVDVLSTGAGDHILAFEFGGKQYSATYTAAGENEILEFDNILPIGTTTATITDPDGLVTCYYITITQTEAVCPEILTDEKTLSVC